MCLSERTRGAEASVLEAKQIHSARPSLRSPGWDSLAWHRFGGGTQFPISINAAEPSSSISAALRSTSGVARGHRNMLRTERDLACLTFSNRPSAVRVTDLGVQAVCRLVLSVPRTGPAVLLTKPPVVRDADPWGSCGKQATAVVGATLTLSGPNSSAAA